MPVAQTFLSKPTSSAITVSTASSRSAREARRADAERSREAQRQVGFADRLLVSRPISRAPTKRARSSSASSTSTRARRSSRSCALPESGPARLGRFRARRRARREGLHEHAHGPHSDEIASFVHAKRVLSPGKLEKFSRTAGRSLGADCSATKACSTSKIDEASFSRGSRRCSAPSGQRGAGRSALETLCHRARLPRAAIGHGLASAWQVGAGPLPQRCARVLTAPQVRPGRCSRSGTCGTPTTATTPSVRYWEAQRASTGCAGPSGSGKTRSFTSSGAY